MRDGTNMTSLRSHLNTATFLGLILLMTLLARSTTIEKESLESIARRSHIIVRGSVAELQPSIKFERFGLFRAKIQVLRIIKGKNVDNFLWAEGCSNKSEPENLATFGSAKFEVGEQVVVFLVQDHGSWEIAGAFQGKFSVVEDRIENTTISVNDFIRFIQEFLDGQRSGIGLRLQGSFDKSGSTRVPLEVSQAPCGGGYSQPYSWLYYYGCNSSYGYIRWPDSGIPPTIYINPTGALDKNGNQLTFNQVKGAIERAFRSWANVPESYINFQIYSSASGYQWGCDNVCVISWRNDLGQNVGGRTFYFYWDANGYTTAADIAFSTLYRWNADDPNYPSNCDESDPNAPKDIEDVAAHEIGHFWGLAHVSDPTATMYASSHRCDTLRRALAIGDMEGAAFLNREASGTISSNVTWCSGSLAAQIHVVGNVTVASGAALTIDPGAIVKFSPGTSLTVNGTVSANSVTFQAQSGTWYGITVNGAQVSSFQNCTIKDGTYGIIVDGSTSLSPSVKRSYVQGSTAAIWIKNNGRPWIENSYLKGTGYSAGTAVVLATNNAEGYIMRSKLFGTYYSGSQYGPQYGHENLNSAITNYNYYNYARNIIDGANFFAYTGASIYVGGGYPLFDNGNNSIPPRTYLYQYYNASGSSRNARYNYWGGGAPVIAGPVVYSPYLSSPPDSVGPNWSLPKLTSNDLATAWQAYFDRDFNRSKQLAQMVFQAQSTTEQSSEALFLWMKSAFQLGNLETEENNLFSFSISNAIHSSAKYESLRWLSKLAAYRGDFKKAEGYAFSIPKTSLYGREIPFDLAVEILERWGDIPKATFVLDKLTERYQDSVTVAEKEFILKIYGDYISRVGSVSPKQMLPIAETVPDKMNLFQAYPNPFNPTTVISYQLPTAGHVSLKVYNMLGQEVAILVDGVQDAGFKSVTFDASRLPSGVYFYKLTAGTRTLVGKAILIK
jgi:hypothetical protein